MTEIDRAEKAAMRTLNDWVDALQPKFNAIEMQALKQRLTAAFREYETRELELLESLGFALKPLIELSLCRRCMLENQWVIDAFERSVMAFEKSRGRD
jgi:hypothetical protein